jgi:phosphohistidine phosphatase
MELILWRHAQAEDGERDLERALTARGRRDAELVGGWLRKRLPGGTAVVLCSPARRALQTAHALGIDCEVLDALSPDASAQAAIAASGWPDRREGTVIVVGHNPWIGEAVARLVAGAPGPWPMRKAGFWWLSRRTAAGGGEVLVKAALSPELLR